MKKLILVLFWFLIPALFGILQAQDLDEILNKHFKATGVENWSKVKTVTMKAAIEQMGMEMPMEMKMKKPNKFRMDMDVQGQKMVQAYDGEKGWMIAPWISSDPQDLEGPQLRQAMDQADMEGELFNYQSKGNKVELIGKETIDGKDYYNIKLTGKDENVKNFFIDASSFLIGRVKAVVNAMGQDMEIEQIMNEYQSVNGIQIPKKIESKTPMGSGFINFKEVVFDAPVEDAIFTRPTN